MNVEYQPGKIIKIGYRSPGLSESHSPAEKVALAKELGMTVMEPQCVPRELPDHETARKMRNAADEAGVSIPSMGAQFSTVENGCDLQAEIAQIIEFAQILGVDYVFSRIMTPPQDVTEKEAWQRLAERGPIVAEGLGEAGIKWAIEADPPCFIHTLERFERAIALIDHPNCYPNFDPTNLYVVGSDPIHAIEVFGTRIVSGHIKDGYYHSPADHGEKPIGTGELDYTAIFKAMMDNGISANMHIEHCQEADCVRNAASHIRSRMESLL
ncbi:MAG: sugar phosphate isomerase/epimerase family protein [Candidatus Sumerlaeota bacterium]